MIDSALLLLRDELSNYLSTKDAVTVVVDNIGLLETPDGITLKDNIVITIVNIEEDRAMKNQPGFNRPDANKSVYGIPPVHLNLFVLFSCNYSGNSYAVALKRLSSVIAFMHSHPVFSGPSHGVNVNNGESSSFRFTVSLHTLTLEQVSHLWGSLGGRQVPFVVYKLSGISIA